MSKEHENRRLSEEELERTINHINHLKAEREKRLVEFLRRNTPETIENELNNYIIGQPEMTRAVSDFLFYHALRQRHPELPIRSILIAGPSGSGKTEVWRVVQKLYGNIFGVKILDGARLSSEGWAGSYKLISAIDLQTINGGILVVDEFDKLCTPQHNAQGENVSYKIQAEFLKLMEGELSQKDRLGNLHRCEKMGFAFLGAFEKLRQNKHDCEAQIGFSTLNKKKQGLSTRLTDEDYIEFGIMTEIIGRISIKCEVQNLSDEDYVQIISNPHSRVATIINVLSQYGLEVCDAISTEKIIDLISYSKKNSLGVRWVSAQLENKLLSLIRECGVAFGENFSEAVDCSEFDI